MKLDSSKNFMDIMNWKLTPYQILTLGIFVLILCGAFLLMLPAASRDGTSIAFVDALFTATSAVCVTGLSVFDTGTQFTLFGQIVIILLIQIGALGFMTMATLMTILMRKKLQLRDRLIMQESLNQLTFSGIVKLVQYIVKATLLIEFIGGSILAVRFGLEYGAEGIYFGYWHAVSAFCNAGFDVIGANRGNLTGYVGDFTVNMALTSLIILGGLGFTVIADIIEQRQFRFFSLHSKIVLAATGVLIFLGTIGIFILEFHNPHTLGPLSLWEKCLASYFQAITVRTAGFSTVSLGNLTHAAVFLMVMLMFIGASPGSTGGGIKTTTFAIIAASIWNQIRGNEDTDLFYRRIPVAIIHKAYTVFFVSLFFISAAMWALVSCNPGFMTEELIFEVVSAFSTTGLTLGITPQLNDAGKYIVAFLMLIGRIGPVTFALALAQRSRKRKIRYPEGKVSIG